MPLQSCGWACHGPAAGAAMGLLLGLPLATGQSPLGRERTPCQGLDTCPAPCSPALHRGCQMWASGHGAGQDRPPWVLLLFSLPSGSSAWRLRDYNRDWSLYCWKHIYVCVTAYFFYTAMEWSCLRKKLRQIWISLSMWMRWIPFPCLRAALEALLCGGRENPAPTFESSHTEDLKVHICQYHLHFITSCCNK